MNELSTYKDPDPQNFSIQEKFCRCKNGITELNGTFMFEKCPEIGVVIHTNHSVPKIIKKQSCHEFMKIIVRIYQPLLRLESQSQYGTFRLGL